MHISTHKPIVASLDWISYFSGDALHATVLFSKVIETYKIEPPLIEFIKRATIAEQSLFIDKLKKGKTYRNHSRWGDNQGEIPAPGRSEISFLRRE